MSDTYAEHVCATTPGVTLRPISQERRAETLVDAMVIEVSCERCGAPLHEVNPGMHDGRVARWVGGCVVCGRQYVLAVEMVRLPRQYDELQEKYGR